MSLAQHVTLRPSQSYLFSYVWLAFELVGFNLMIHYLLPSNALFVLTLFMVCFARLYYWLDFSPANDCNNKVGPSQKNLLLILS